MKRLFIIIGLFVAIMACKAQTEFYDLIKAKYDDYYRYSRTNLKEAEKAKNDLVAYATLVALFMLEHGQDESGHLATLESALETWSRTTLTTPSITYETTVDNEFGIILIDSVTFDGGTTYNSYILDSATVEAIAGALDAALDSASVKDLAIDTSGVHHYDSLRVKHLYMGESDTFQFHVSYKNSYNWFTISNVGAESDSIRFGLEEGGNAVWIAIGSADNGLVISGDGVGFANNNVAIWWDDTYLQTSNDTVAWLSDLLTHTADETNPHSVTKAQVSLTNVTDDAQLKREAGDVNTFSSKATPSDDDILLIEDSDASYAKKKVLISNLPSGVLSVKEDAIDTVEWHDFNSLSSDTSKHYSFIKVGRGQDSLYYIDVDDQGGIYNNVCFFDDYIIVAAGTDGIRSYSVDKEGNLTFVDIDDQGGDYFDVCADDSFIYVGCGTAGLRSYSIDSDGVFTYIDNDAQGGNYFYVAADDSFIYVSCWVAGIKSYSSNAGELTFIDSDLQGAQAYNGLYTDSTYVYICCSGDGLRTYLTYDGALTHVDTDDQGGSYNDISCDGSYFYVAAGSGGLHNYTASAGVLTHVDTDDQGGVYGGVVAYNGYVYIASNATGIRSYSVDFEGTLTHIELDERHTDIVYVETDRNFLYFSCTSEGLRIASTYGYTKIDDFIRINPLQHLPLDPSKGTIIVDIEGNALLYNGADWDTLNVPSGGSGVQRKSISFFCTADSIAEVADSTGYAVITGDFTGMELQDMQVRSFNNADRIVSVDAYRIRGAAVALMTSTEATLGAEYTISDETVDAANDDVQAGDIIYVRWEQGAGDTRHFGLFVGLDFE